MSRGRRLTALRALLMTLILSATLMPDLAWAGGCAPSISAYLVKRQGDELDFELRNSSHSDIILPRHMLPWSWTRAVVITAVGLQTGNSLPQSVVISDPVPEDVIVRPGQTLRGKVNINHHVQNFGLRAREQDLVVFWYYKAIDRENRCVGESGGYFGASKDG